MVHLEQAQPEQLQELLAFAEEAFRTPEGKVDFPTLLPKLYGPGADSAPLHTVLYEDGAPAGLYCLKIQDFNIAGTALRVGGIGTVCVDGRSRGKGHLALLMQDAQERMQAAGCDIAMLGGQRQRAYIAMVIAQDTEFILLDEPTNNLDIYHATNMMKIVRRLCDELGKTVILVLHEINYAAFYSDYICAFKDGKIAKFGTVEEVMTKENLSQIYQVDFEILTIAGKPLSIYY